VSVPLDWKFNVRSFAAATLPVADTDDRTTPRFTVPVCWTTELAVDAGAEETTRYATSPITAASASSPRLSQRTPPRPRLEVACSRSAFFLPKS